MSPRKLTDSDKQEILELYRTPQETTSTLAERYQVSSSTISRFLKNNLAGDEYEALIQQKRLSRTPGGAAQILSQFSEQQGSPSDVKTDGDSSSRRTRRRSSAVSEPKEERQQPPQDLSDDSELVALDEDEDEDDTDVHALEEMLGEDIGELEDEDDLDNFEDEEWEEDLDEEVARSASKDNQIQVLPLSEAAFPKICYLVVDRASELIALPLKDFGDLGQIPAEETREKTLPIFDNHRVARRFSNRSQRVIKVPDGQVLGKVSIYLLAKGITRLLIGGQVYAVSSSV